ncbi:MAG: hypothetical protein AB7E42_09580 [Anaerotignaceae bacterium]
MKRQNLEGFALKHPQGFHWSALCDPKLSYGQMACLCHCQVSTLPYKAVLRTDGMSLPLHT